MFDKRHKQLIKSPLSTQTDRVGINERGYLFSSLHLDNNIFSRDIFSQINNFKDKVNEISSDFLHDHINGRRINIKSLKKAPSKIVTNHVRSKTKNVTLAFNDELIKKLLTKDEDKKHFLINHMIDGKFSSLNMPSPYLNQRRGKEMKIVDQPFEINKELIQTSKKKADELKQKLYQLKNARYLKNKLKLQNKESKILLTTTNSKNNIQTLQSKRINKPDEESLISSEDSFINSTPNLNLKNDTAQLTNYDKYYAFSNENSQIDNMTQPNKLITIYGKSNSVMNSPLNTHHSIKRKLLSIDKTHEFYKNCNNTCKTLNSLNTIIEKDQGKLAQSLYVAHPKNLKNDIEKQMLVNTYGRKKEMGLFVYRNTKGKDKGNFINQDSETSNAYNIITNVDDIAAYRMRNILIQKFGITTTPADTFHQFKFKPKKDEMNKHSLVRELVDKLRNKTIKIDKKIDKIKLKYKDE